MDAKMLSKDAHELHELWSGKRPGSGLETAKQQTLRLLSFHEDGDRRVVTRLIAERFTDDEERKAFLCAVNVYLYNEGVANADYSAMRRIEDSWA